MVRTTALRWIALLIPLLIIGPQGLQADDRPGKHKHDGKTPSGKTAGIRGRRRRDRPTNTPGGNTPGSITATAHSTRWGDAAAIARGQQLYQTNCLMCHGAMCAQGLLPKSLSRMPRRT